jgi:hypothetical protein
VEQIPCGEANIQSVGQEILSVLYVYSKNAHCQDFCLLGHRAMRLRHAGLLLVILFNPNEGGNIFLRKFGCLPSLHPTK